MLVVPADGKVSRTGYRDGDAIGIGCIGGFILTGQIEPFININIFFIKFSHSGSGKQQKKSQP